MTESTPATLSSILLALAFVVSAASARGDEAVVVSLIIKDHQFDPAEVHAPTGRPIVFNIKNLGSIAAEFESSELHVEKVIPPGRDATVRVRPLEPGRYNFFDDFHRETQGFLIVP
jgi:heme/copper-type cytochrome/quinol oxidase subunit 2